MIFDLSSSRPPLLEDSHTQEPMASLAFSPAEFVPTPINTSLDQYPMFVYPFAAQATAGDTDTTQYLFMDAPRAWEDGLGSWGSSDSSAPTSTTTTFDNAWSRQQSLNTDLCSAYGSSNPFDQSPNWMTQPASASFDSTILPSLHTQMSSAKMEKTKCNDTGKKEKLKLIKSSSSTPWNSLLASQPQFVIAPKTRTASRMHPSSSQANPKSEFKATTGASAVQQRSHKRPIATVERDASKGEQTAKAVGLESSDDEAENISDGGDAGGAQCKFKPALERNRMAATKCRAKAKAAVLQLEEDDQIISMRNSSLEAEVAALREQVLGLRMQLLEHGDCDCTPIQQYIQNAAELIGNTGGRHPIWGPDGHDGEWAVCSPNTSGL